MATCGIRPCKAGVDGWFTFSMSAWICASTSSIRSNLWESSSFPVAVGVGVRSSSPVHPAIDASSRVANIVVARSENALFQCRVAIPRILLLSRPVSVSESTGSLVARRANGLSLSGRWAAFPLPPGRSKERGPAKMPGPGWLTTPVSSSGFYSADITTLTFYDGSLPESPCQCRRSG